MKTEYSAPKAELIELTSAEDLAVGGNTTGSGTSEPLGEET